MNLLYIAIGESINTHIQAHFSIYTFLTQGKKINTINIITDSPYYYNDIGSYLNIIKVDEKQLKKWKGEHNFFWRIKIKAIELLCNLYKNEPVLYLDGDTFLYKNIEPLKETMLQGIALMHENEGNLSLLKGKTLRKMWAQVKNNIYNGIAILPSHSMWNAGVVATPNQKNNEECLLALSICDEMCKQDVTPRLIEQFALSVALNEIYGLHPADNTIAHYWSNKDEWNGVIEKIFISEQFKLRTIEQTIEIIKEFDFSKVAIKTKVRNTNKRLKSVVEKSFPTKNIAFVKNALQ